MASSPRSGDAGADNPPESAPGNPTGPDPPTNPRRDDDSPAQTSAAETPSGYSDASATGTAEVPYPPPLPFRSSAPKKRPLSVADERGYREKSMRHTWGGLRLPAASPGAATRVPPDERSWPRVDYSKSTPLAGSREPSSNDDKDKAPQIVVLQPKGFDEGCPAQRCALQLSTEFIRLLNPQAVSSAATGADLDGGLDDEAIDNLLNEVGMEAILKTSIPTVYSKEILYEILMECVGRYPEWLEDNKDKVVKEKHEQYQKQLQLMVRLALVYDKEPGNLSNIMKLMYKIGEYGPPPSGIINAISPRLYQSIMKQLAAAGVVDILHDKVLQPTKVQTKGLHEGCSAQRLAGKVPTEFMRRLDPEVGSGFAAGRGVDSSLVQDAIKFLLNMEGMQVNVKEILDELQMEFVRRYSKWVEDNKDKVGKEEDEQYQKQLQLVVRLTTVYDEKPENYSKMLKLMYKIRECGPPLSDVIHAISSPLYQSTMVQHAAVGVADVLHDKVPQVIEVQTKGLHEGFSAQRLVGQVSTEFMQPLDPEAGSGTAVGSDLDGKLVQDAIVNLLNGEGMQDIVKTSIPKVYSKEVFYELIMAYVGQYPKWLEDNEDKLGKENHEQYMVQFQFMVDLTNVYEEEPENFSKIMKLMYKIRKYGPTPSGVIDAVSPCLYQSTMEQLFTGMVELLQDLDKLFRVHTSPSATST